MNLDTLKIKRKIKGVFGRNSENGRASFVLAYLHHRHKFPNLKHPRNISEIWICKVLSGEVNSYSYLADKYAVRSYVDSKGLGSLLTPLVAVYDNVDEIDFDILPSRFAMKSNTGAGNNIICSDKSKLDADAARETMKSWLVRSRYSYTERHYDKIVPKIVCEEFIDDGTGGFPVDYKFMCIKGKVFCVLACRGRESGHADYLPYSLEWIPLYQYVNGSAVCHTLTEKPANLDEMVRAAETLASDVDLVRVDLYSSGSRIWFGEMTLTPAGCIFPRWTMKALKDMGRAYKSD